ncbi:MAG TPA: undecaprenyl-diphosphatase [Candidatus Moranbacteria bacterium]|nr:undecaprenyl-diphosphatase [Candidatus Moranbacteria bacterium]
MLNLFDAFILGIVEGITEFLPVSSTAHLILATDFLGLENSDFIKSFEIIIQFGAILAVVFLYWRSFLDKEILKKLAVAFIPTGVLGLIFYKIVKTYLLGNIAVVLWSLALGGLFLIIFEKYFAKKEVGREMEFKSISYRQCLALGVFQSVAMVPGVSRSASTIIGGLLLGISRKTIVEFSFLLAVPTMLAAAGLDLFKNAGSFDSSQFQFLLVGFATSFVMAIVAIRWLLSYIKRNSFAGFGIYRIILAALFLFFL